MLKTIHATLGPNADPITAAKNIRRAFLAMGGQDTSISRAAALFEVIEKRGIALIGRVQEERVENVVHALQHDAALKAYVDLPPEGQIEAASADAAAAPNLPAPTQPPPIPPVRPQPTIMAYKTAMAWLVASDGNPLKAAAHAHTVARAMNAEKFYATVQDALVDVFPWLDEMLKREGIRA